MNNYLVLSALGESRTSLVVDLTRAIVDCKCNVIDSRMTALGQAYGLLMLVEGNWNTLAKLEVQLERLAQAEGLQLSAQRTQQPSVREDVVPYAIEVVALDQTGIVFRLAEFFATRSIQIEDMASRSYQASHTGATMSAVNVVVAVPSEVHIAVLREEFMDFCDQFNWDAVLEPVKG